MKKLLSILLCLAMLVGCMPGVFAAPAFTEYQDFEDATVVTDGLSYGACYDVFEYGYPYGATVTIEDDGYRGGKSMHITEDGGDGFSVRNIAAADVGGSNTTVFAFKMKIVNEGNFIISTGWNDMLLVNSANGKIQPYGDPDAGMAYTLDKWYDVSVFLAPDKGVVTVTDGIDDVVVTKEVTDATFFKLRGGDSKNAAVAGSEIAIDDVRVWKGAGADAPALVSCSHMAETAAADPTTVLFEDNFDEMGDDAAAYLEAQTNAYETVGYDANTKFAKAAGVTGNGLNITGGTDALIQLETVTYDIPETGKLYGSMRLKLNDWMSSNGAIAHITEGQGKETVDSRFVINKTAGIGCNYTYSAVEEEWFTLVFEWSMNPKAQMVVSLYNQNGELIDPAATSTKADWNLPNTDYAAMSIYCASGKGLDYTIDDIMFISEPAGVTGTPALDKILNRTASAVPAVAKAYSTTPTIDLTFDQPINGTISVKEGEKVVYTSPAIEEKIAVKIMPVGLDFGKTYTIDFSNVKSIAGTAAAITPVTFDTAPQSESGALALGTVSYGAERQTMTVPVTFTYANVAEADYEVIAALYKDGKLEWFDVEKVYAGAMDESTSVTYSKVPADAENMTLKVFVFNGLASLQPLFNAAVK